MGDRTLTDSETDSIAANGASVSLDMDALTELQDILEDEFTGLLDEFIESSRETSAELATMVGQEDLTELRRGAHSLKGSALNIGAPSLGQAWSTLEDAAVSALEQAQLEVLLRKANAELDRTVAELKVQFF